MTASIARNCDAPSQKAGAAPPPRVADRMAVRVRSLILPPERRSLTRRVLKFARKRAGSETGAPQCRSNRGTVKRHTPSANAGNNL